MDPIMSHHFVFLHRSLVREVFFFSFHFMYFFFKQNFFNLVFTIIMSL